MSDLSDDELEILENAYQTGRRPVGMFARAAEEIRRRRETQASDRADDAIVGKVMETLSLARGNSAATYAVALGAARVAVNISVRDGSGQPTLDAALNVLATAINALFFCDVAFNEDAIRGAVATAADPNSADDITDRVIAILRADYISDLNRGSGDK